MKITADLLRKKEACEKDVIIFEKEWPDGCSVTRANCIRAATLEFDFDWAAMELLSNAAEYEYDKLIDVAFGEYRKNNSFALNWRERETVWNEYRKAMAIAFWRAATRTKRGC